MNKSFSLGLLVAGTLLLIYGLAASHSAVSDVTRFFTGNPTDKTMWLLIGGALAAIVGAAGLRRGVKTA